MSAPIGTVIHLSGEQQGSWLKINHRTDVPTSLMVQHFVNAADALRLLVAARAHMAQSQEQDQGLLREIEALLCRSTHSTTN